MLADVFFAQRLYEGDQLAQQRIGDPGHPRTHDLAFALGVGKADVQVQAAALERIAQFARVVGREDD